MATFWLQDNNLSFQIEGFPWVVSVWQYNQGITTNPGDLWHRSGPTTGTMCFYYFGLPDVYYPTSDYTWADGHIIKITRGVGALIWEDMGPEQAPSDTPLAVVKMIKVPNAPIPEEAQKYMDEMKEKFKKEHPREYAELEGKYGKENAEKNSEIEESGGKETAPSA